MKPAASLTRSAGAQPDDDAPDEALVKMRTLRAFIARVMSKIPTPAGGIKVRRSLFGDVWQVDGSSASHPFKVTAAGEDLFTVQAGTCEGQFIATQTLDVGSDRPVAILAYPQYDVSVWNSEYVWAATVKTGAEAPILTYSTAILSDVTTVSVAGNEGRALIAYIDNVDGVDVIAQVATGNIAGTFEDGGLTGNMTGSYNKAL